MGMNSIKGELEIEILSDPTDANAAKKARRRMDNCVQSAQECLIAGYNGNAASRNSGNGMPDEEYGDL